MMYQMKTTFRVLALAALIACFSGTAHAGVDEDLMILMGDVNVALDGMGSDLRLEMIEYLTESDQMGRTLRFSDVGNKQLGFDFVPGDPRRTWSGPVGPDDDIVWATDLTQGDAGVGFAGTQQAIASAMATWEDISCSEMPLTEVQPGGDLGFLEFLLTGGASGSAVPAGDVTHAGFNTAVDAILPLPIIAAAFTFRFVDGGGNSTDIDNNGTFDAALREIYYTANFPWSLDGVGGIDIETVVLHETGHGLSQAHFGQLFSTDANGQFHFAPRAVMNAGYTGVQRDLTGSDTAGHCSNWGSWPQN